MDLLWQIPLYLTAGIIFYRFLRYITTPLARKLGIYKYYNDVFFTVPGSMNRVEVHLGTAWDFFKMKKVNPKIFLYYTADGFYKLCEAIERGEVKNDRVYVSTICFFTDSTLTKFGFRTRKLYIREMIIFSLNYFEQCLLQSLSRGRISVVDLRIVRKLTLTTEDLIANKDNFKLYADMLKPQYTTGTLAA
ncbi:MAG: hypothetical protein KDC42_09230 [Ignavibacteriae bacterium]|nr:hypothetical protein [Ignavibacteriota bacterium]